MDKTRIKKIIRAKFKTETACARAMGWPRQRLNKITNGVKVPTIKEVNELSLVLDTSVGDIVKIFL